MSAEYEPGTVAVATVDGVTQRIFRTSRGWADQQGFHWSESFKGRIEDIHPLVVLDLDYIRFKPYGLPQVLDLLRGDHASKPIAEQIEAQTKPPRIPEPGLWGVVKARLTSVGRSAEWTAVHTEDGWRVDDGGTFEWGDLIDPTLIREGVES